MPAGARWLFWLTWLLLGLAVFMLAALLSMWRHRRGDVGPAALLSGADRRWPWGLSLLAETGFLGLPLR
ncbi:MAG: hypothetical protein R3A10_03900 [Caldilineaceae bacterium]